MFTLVLLSRVAVYVVVCGGLPGVEIHTVDKIVLSLGIEVSTEQFFDAHYLMRNLASLFGIPNGRMRVPNVVHERRRREDCGMPVAPRHLDADESLIQVDGDFVIPVPLAALLQLREIERLQFGERIACGSSLLWGKW